MADVIDAFDRAAATYDASSALQREVAEQLVRSAAARMPATILDIGCGTGHVSVLARKSWPHARITALDSSPSMLSVALKNVRGLEAIQGDARHIESVARYDAIFSSMLLHWLPDPRDVLLRWRKLLTPQGRLFVALPVHGSLGEWRRLCRDAGIRDGLWPFPDAGFAEAHGLSTRLRKHAVAYPTLYAFLKSLKNTGAYRSHPDHKLPSSATMRRLIATNAKSFQATYHVLYIEGTRDSLLKPH